MTQVIRIDEEVMGELRKRAIDLGLVREPLNATLRRILGLDSHVLVAQASISPTGAEETTTEATTLIIHVPFSKGVPGAPNSFEAYMQTGVAKGYALTQKEVSALHPGCKVVLLRNDKKKSRAEGVLVKLVKTNQKTPQGIPRYDVFFQDQKAVNYSYAKPAERLNRRGIKVIDC